MYTPRLSVYHANAKATGSAIHFSIQKATAVEDGRLIVCMANQQTTGSEKVFPKFDWGKSVTVKLTPTEIAEIIEVLQGDKESIQDGKGIIYNTGANRVTLTFTHIPSAHAHGYGLELHVKGEIYKITFNSAESVAIEYALKYALGIVAFGNVAA